MEFDITNLDRRILIRTLLSHAEPVGFGTFEYDNRKANRENVDGLTDEECDEILYEFENMKKGYVRVLDYYRGQPLKLDFYKKDNGQMLASSTSYDERNGKYRFFEAMLNAFLVDEIKIVRKGYGERNITGQPEHIERSNQTIKVFQNIVENCESQTGKFGRYWTINSSFKFENGNLHFLNI